MAKIEPVDLENVESPIRKVRAFGVLGIILILVSPARSQERLSSLAILETGSFGKQAAEALSQNLIETGELRFIDRGQASTAARGAGYSGSFNLSTLEARNLGSVLGCDFFLILNAETSRRSPSTGPSYFESYAWIFLVSGRTGRLISWRHPSLKAPTSEAAEKLLLDQLGGSTLQTDYRQKIRRAALDEQRHRQRAFDRDTPLIEAAPDNEAMAEAQGLQLPRPYRRLIPTYPETAAQAEIEAVVDVLVDLDAQGEVNHAEVARWAGFGLDEVTLNTVRQLHFFPAMRNGTPVPLRILLRYNFRKPALRQ